MLSRTAASQSTRGVLLLRRAGSHHVQWPAAPSAASPPSITPLPASRRSYAAKKKTGPSPTVAKARRRAEQSRIDLGGASASAAGAEPIMAVENVPSLGYFERAVTLVPTSNLSPGEAQQLTRLYCGTVTVDNASLKVFEKEHNVVPPTLHNLATLILSNPYTQDLWKLGMHMLHHASERGHVPSTLSVLSFHYQFVQPRNGQDSSSSSSSSTGSHLFRAAQTKFDAYLTTRAAHSDPDALSLAGLAALSKGQDVQAQRWLAKALETAPPVPADHQQQHPRPARFTWEATALNTLAGIHLLKQQKQQQRGDSINDSAATAAALALYRTAALELDSADACFAAGKLLWDTDRGLSGEAERFLTKAAVSGDSGAAALMGGVEMWRAKRCAAGRREEAWEHEKMGAEWCRIAAADKVVEKRQERYS